MKELPIENNMMLMMKSIKQPYALTMARHRLKKKDMQIMMMILRALQPRMIHDKHPFELYQTDLGDTRIRIPTKSLLKEGQKNYEVIRKSLRALTRNPIEIKICNEEGICREVFTNLIMRGKFSPRSHFVEIDIAKEFLPELLGLAKGYSRYLIDVAFNASSPNVMKLYYFISHWRDKKQVGLYVKDFKKWLQIEDKYPLPHQIKNNILLPAQKELEEKADMYFTIAESIKVGRNVLGWKLNICKNKAYKELMPPPLSAVQKSNNNERLHQRLTEEFQLSPRQADKVLAKAERQILYKALYEIRLLRLDKKISNVGGYTAKVLAEKFSLKL